MACKSYSFFLTTLTAVVAVSLSSTVKLIEGTSVTPVEIHAESVVVKGLNVDQTSQDTLLDEHLSENRPAREGKKKKDSPVKPITCDYQGKVPIPYECRRFLACPRPGAQSKLAKCPEKQVFHHQMRTCMKLTVKECRQSMCKKTTDVFPDPYSKDKYLSCLNMYPDVKECSKATDPTAKLVCAGTYATDIKAEDAAELDEEIYDDE